MLFAGGIISCCSALREEEFVTAKLKIPLAEEGGERHPRATCRNPGTISNDITEELALGTWRDFPNRDVIAIAPFRRRESNRLEILYQFLKELLIREGYFRIGHNVPLLVTLSTAPPRLVTALPTVP